MTRHRSATRYSAITPFPLTIFSIVASGPACRPLPPAASPPATTIEVTPSERAAAPSEVTSPGELTLPEQCKVSDAGALPIFIHNGSPFVETPIRGPNQPDLGSLSIDYGTAACTKLDKTFANTLGFKSAERLKFCGQGLLGYPGVTVVQWAGYEVVAADYSTANHLPGHADQAGILAAGTLNEQMVELDLGSSPAGESASMTLYRPNPNPCGTPRAVIDACRSRWANVKVDEIQLKYFSSCLATQRAENQPSAGGDLLPVVPTVEARVGDTNALLQIDTGREDVDGYVDISVNQTLLATIEKTSTLREVSVTTVGTCPVHTYTGTSLPSLKLGTRTFQLERLQMREPSCGPPYSLDGPHGLLGASVLRSARRLVIDPASELMLIQWRS